MKLRGRAVAAVAIALLLLSGCAGLTPGTAAVVNGSRITDEQVADLAHAQCVAAERAAAQGSTTTTPLAQVKQQSLGLLMDTELSRQYAKDEGLTAPTGLAQGIYAQFQPSIDPLPGSARAVLREVFQDWARGRALLVEAGSRATGQQVSNSNVQQLLNAGLQAREPWLKKADIETDPRYDPSKEGFPGGGSGSVSKPVSKFAKDAGKDQPDAAWVSGLPASQKCG